MRYSPGVQKAGRRARDSARRQPRLAASNRGSCSTSLCRCMAMSARSSSGRLCSSCGGGRGRGEVRGGRTEDSPQPAPFPPRGPRQPGEAPHRVRSGRGAASASLPITSGRPEPLRFPPPGPQLTSASRASRPNEGGERPPSLPDRPPPRTTVPPGARGSRNPAILAPPAHSWGL